MTDKMLKFVEIGQQTPPKRGVDNRKKDFNEIYDDFIKQKAQEQSSRCSQCGVPFCQVHCPLSNNIPDWLKLTAEGRLKEAYELSQSTNNMPEVCGRICPQDRLCEGNCVIEQSGHGTVTIGSMEKYITDNAWEQGWVKPIDVKYERDQSVPASTPPLPGQFRHSPYHKVVSDIHPRPAERRRLPRCHIALLTDSLCHLPTRSGCAAPSCIGCGQACSAQLVLLSPGSPRYA